MPFPLVRKDNAGQKEECPFLGLLRQLRVRAAACCKGARSVSQGYVCYKPVEQRACYLRRMDAWDLQTLQTSLNASEQRVSSCCSRSPGRLSGRGG